MKNNDIFDKVMSVRLFDKIRPFYKAHKEVLLYLFFGGLTTVISILTYALFTITFQIDELIANIFSWIASVLFAFITNRIWVFESEVNTHFDFLKQLFKFYSGRIATLLVEELILWVFITKLDFNGMVVKIMAQIIIVILNYIISKLFVFKKTS